MKKLLSALAVAVALTALGSSRVVAADLLVKGEVPFAFSAAGNQLPAGQYQVSVEDPTANVLVLQDVSAKKSVMVPFLTRLATTNDVDAELVFDKDASGTYLSEIRIPGRDGYFIPGAKGEHTHVRVKASKAGKK
jgi:hypothetical protein